MIVSLCKTVVKAWVRGLAGAVGWRLGLARVWPAAHHRLRRPYPAVPHALSATPGPGHPHLLPELPQGVRRRACGPHLQGTCPSAAPLLHFPEEAICLHVMWHGTNNMPAVNGLRVSFEYHADSFCLANKIGAQEPRMTHFLDGSICHDAQWRANLCLQTHVLPVCSIFFESQKQA